MGLSVIKHQTRHFRSCFTAKQLQRKVAFLLENMLEFSKGFNKKSFGDTTSILSRNIKYFIFISLSLFLAVIFIVMIFCLVCSK